VEAARPSTASGSVGSALVVQERQIAANHLLVTKQTDVDGPRRMAVPLPSGKVLVTGAPQAGTPDRRSCTKRTTIAPSPTAVAHRLIEPERTSPAA
jgi:hypothetical protein